VGLLATLLLVASRTVLVADQGRAPTGFLDAHVHLNDAAAWVALMDEAGIAWSVVFAGRHTGNAGLLDAARRWPGRFRPFVSVSPEHPEFRRYWEADDEALVRVAEAHLAGGGFFGIGEISVTHFGGPGFPEANFDPQGRVMRGLLRLARTHGVPVTVHVEVTRLRELDTLLTAFPDVTVIWAHGGYTPLLLAERMLRAHANLVYELSARTWARHPRSPEYTIVRDETGVWPEWLALIEAMPTRFIVGTDAPVRSRQRDRAKIDGVERLLGQLSPHARALVARGNLERILGCGAPPGEARC
jgi:predicted TIM-barrel fold metal-dependent hydrolase